MIADYILSIPAFLLLGFLNFLPNGGTFPAEWTEAVYTIYGYINAFSFIVPVDTLLWCLGIAMTYHLAVLGFKVFHWAITKIPFIG